MTAARPIRCRRCRRNGPEEEEEEEEEKEEEEEEEKKTKEEEERERNIKENGRSTLRISRRRCYRVFFLIK